MVVIEDWEVGSFKHPLRFQSSKEMMISNVLRSWWIQPETSKTAGRERQASEFRRRLLNPPKAHTKLDNLPGITSSAPECVFATSTWRVGGLGRQFPRGRVFRKGTIADIFWLGVGLGEGTCKCGESEDEDGRGSHISGLRNGGIEKVSGYWRGNE